MDSPLFFFSIKAMKSNSIVALPSKQRLHKLDRVGPVDNRPSTNNLHQFVKKEKKVTYDT